MILSRVIAVILMIGFLISCNGQAEQKSNKKERNRVELDQNIWNIFQDSKGRYWFGSNGSGVYLYDGDELTQFTREDGLIDNTIRSVQEDGSGNILIETPEGVSKYNEKTFRTLPIVKSTETEWKLEADDIWYSSNGNALDIYRCDGEALYELTLPRQDLIKAFGDDFDPAMRVFSFNVYSVFGIDKDAAGNLWIGTCAAGAYRYDGESFTWFGEKELTVLEDGRVPGVRSMIQDKDGYFWLSNIISKYRVHEDGSYEQLPGIDLSEQDVEIELPYFMSAVKDDEGNLWMSSYGQGVWMWDGEKLEQYKLKEGNKEVTLISIYKDRKGMLWLTSDISGVWKKEGNTFKKFK